MIPERVEWQRGFPTRALRVFGWYVAFGLGVVAVAWILFGSEPRRVGSGEANPLAYVPAGTALFIAALAVPVLFALMRRPHVSADHYALTIRPGAVRTLVLPWAHVAEIAGYVLGGEPFLLVRCDGTRDHLGDRPRWWDRGGLRSASWAAGRMRPRGAGLAEYDLGVRMDGFLGPARAKLLTLARYAPGHVLVIDKLA
jgi:hypothetical protein